MKSCACVIRWYSSNTWSDNSTGIVPRFATSSATRCISSSFRLRKTVAAESSPRTVRRIAALRTPLSFSELAPSLGLFLQPRTHGGGAALRLSLYKLGELLLQKSGNAAPEAAVSGIAPTQAQDTGEDGLGQAADSEPQERAFESAESSADKPGGRGQQSRIANHRRIVIQTLSRLVHKSDGWKIFCHGRSKLRFCYADHIAACTVESDGRLRQFADEFQSSGCLL
jgi:hypothetical protein